VKVFPYHIIVVKAHKPTHFSGQNQTCIHKKQKKQESFPAFFISRKCMLFLFALQILHVDGVLHLFALLDGRLGEILATTQLFEYARAFVFPFEFLEGAFDVFALFDWHDNHKDFVFYFCFCEIAGKKFFTRQG